MEEVPLDESDNKSCQEFFAKAIEKDKLDLLFNFMQRKKSFGKQKDVFKFLVSIFHRFLQLILSVLT